MKIERRTFLGAAIAAAVVPGACGMRGGGCNGRGRPLSQWGESQRAGAPAAPVLSAEEFPYLLLELCGKYPGEEGPDGVTHLASRRMVSVDIEDEDDWGDLNTFWDGEEMAWGLGNDVDGYWKIVRVFEMIEPRIKLHEAKFPVARELTFEQFAALVDRRVESCGREPG